MKTLECGDKYAVTVIDDGTVVVSIVDSADGTDLEHEPFKSIEFWNGPEMSEFISDVINAYREVFDDDPFI